jgi:pheromone receptor transcription factor
MGRPQGTGRRKIDIKRIEKKQSRLVTFSKRRQGLFSKAAQLCSSSGANIAVVIFSPHDRPYAFGHPSTDAVIERFLGSGERLKEVEDTVEGEPGEGKKGFQLDTALDLDEVEQSEAILKQMKKNKGFHQLDMAVEKMLEQSEAIMKQMRNKGFSLDIAVENMGLDELEQSEALLNRIRNRVAMLVDEMGMRRVATREFFPLNPLAVVT